MKTQLKLCSGHPLLQVMTSENIVFVKTNKQTKQIKPKTYNSCSGHKSGFPQEKHSTAH